MSKISNIIELFIKELLEDAQDTGIEIQRNELASYFNCAPSQINYVLMTRFTMDKGYVIDSRRGGGGYIKIIRLNLDKNKYIQLLMREIGDAISQMKAEAMIQRLLERGFINARESKIMASAMNDKTLTISMNTKDEVRANILKNMLAAILIFNQ